MAYKIFDQSQVCQRFEISLMNKMADSMISLSSRNHTQFNPLNWDLHEINRYKDKKCFAYDGNRIKWTDTYEMLRLFIKCGVSQPGIWSAPGGKYKKFCSNNKDLTVTWNYESGNLSFKGETGDVLRSLLINLCTDGGILSKHRSHSDYVPSDKLLHVTQSVPVTGVMGVVCDRNESKCEMLSPVTDFSTLDELQQFIDLSYQNVLAHEMSSTQAIDSSTPFKSRPADSPTSLEHQFNTFKANIESKVAALLAKIEDQSYIIDKNNQELCKLTKDNLHLKSRLSDLEEKVFPKSESTVLISPDINATHSNSQINLQTTNSCEMDSPRGVHPPASPQITVPEVITDPEVMIPGSLPGHSGKCDRKPAPINKNLRNKARVFCPFLKRKGHCLKGCRCDFSYTFTSFNERGSKFQQNSLERFPPSNIYPNSNLPPFPFNPNFPVPFRHPTFRPLSQSYHQQYPYPPPLMNIPTRTPTYWNSQKRRRDKLKYFRHYY